MLPPGAVGALASLSGGASDGAKLNGAEQAARQLEVTFLTQLIQAMRKTVTESDLLPRSPEKDVYDGAFDASVAEGLAARDPLGMVASLGRAGAGSSPEGKMSIVAVEGQMTGRSDNTRRNIP